MNRNYYNVNRSPINSSPSKQIYGFPRANRFPSDSVSPCIRHSYDISKSPIKNSKNVKDTFGKTERFNKNHKSSGLETDDRPSPNKYNLTGFIQENKYYKKGTSFGKDTRDRSKKWDAPGPGSYNYDGYNPEKNISFTMRSRTKTSANQSWNVNQQQLQDIGPGHYYKEELERIGSKHQISKYKNPTQGKILRSQRFKDQRQRSFSPGPDHYPWEKTYEIARRKDEPSSKFLNEGCYSFRKSTKLDENNFERLNSYKPGPGAYEVFTEFADINKNSLSRLRTHYF